MSTNTKTDQTPLATAIKYLSAVRVGRTEYAYYDDASRDWCVEGQACPYGAIEG